MSNMKLLEINNLNKSFDNKEILKDINLSIQHGKIIGLLGKNGVGKTTLLKIIKAVRCKLEDILKAIMRL